MGKAGGQKKGAKKKTWTKVKVRDKLNNDVFLDDKRFQKLSQEIPKILVITRSAIMEKFKVNGSIARALIKKLAESEAIKPVGEHSAKFDLYTGAQAKSALERAAEEAAAAEQKDKKKK